MLIISDWWMVQPSRAKNEFKRIKISEKNIILFFFSLLFHRSLSLWHSLGFQLSSYKRLLFFFLLHMMLHDDSWLWDRFVDGFVRQHVGTVQVKLVVHNHILTQHRHVLHTNLMTQVKKGKPSTHLTAIITQNCSFYKKWEGTSRFTQGSKL